MLKSALLVLALFATAGICACSCSNTYVSLEDMLCRAEERGGAVIEIRMTSRAGTAQSADFSLLNVWVGESDVRSLNVISPRHSCAGWFNEGDRVGNRYLLFTNPDALANGQEELFSCGWYGNLFELDHTGTKIRYPGNQDGRATEPRYEMVGNQLTNHHCGDKDSQPNEQIKNPLRDVRILANPGVGVVQFTSPEETLPAITKVEVYDYAGRRILAVKSPGEDNSPGPINFQAAPRGFYTIIIRQNSYERGLRYLKVN